MQNRINKIVVIGDSIVFGRVDPEGGGWVGRFKRWFELFEPTSNAVYNLGIGGNNTNDLLDRVGAEITQRKPDLIVLSIGVNDLRKVGGRSKINDIPVEEYSSNLKRLLDVSKSICSNVIFFGMVPVDENRTAPIKGKGYWHLIKEQAKYQRRTLEILGSYEVTFIDNFNRWFNFGNERNSYKKLLFDGLHPNAKGHKELYHKFKKIFINKYYNDISDK